MSIPGGWLEMLDPTLGPADLGRTLSPRLNNLEGKTIGVIWNGRPPGDLTLKGITDRLKERHGVKEIVFRDKPHIGNMAPIEMIDELAAKCDAVIAGVGD